MDSDTLEFIRVLTLSNVELWQYKNDQHSLISKGPLEVLFSKDLNLALFKLHNFKYALDRTLKVTASSDNDKQFRTYLLPGGDGCYILRLGVPSSEPSVVNFETIIENSCQLVRNPDLETYLLGYKDKIGLIHKGENLIKQTYIKSSSLVSKGINTIIHKVQGENPNQSLVRKIEEIRLTDKDQTGFETFLRNEAIELMEASNEFSKRQEDGFWNHFGGNSEETPITKPDEIRESPFKKENESADVSKTAGGEKTGLQALNEKGHTLLDKARETIGNMMHKKEEIVEETLEEREAKGKELKREDQLTDISEMNLSVEEKTRLQKLNEKGHALVDKAKESLGSIAKKITGKTEIKEEDKVFLRSDNFTDIGQMEYLPIDEKSALQKVGETVVDAAKDTINTLTSILPGQGEGEKDLKEEAAQKGEEIKDKAAETQEEKTPVLEQAKEFIRKASKKLEEYRDDGDLSSETTIQPNREGPSPIDKVNEQYAKVADKVVEKVEEVVGVKIEEGESLTDIVKEKASEIKDKIAGSDDNEGFKEIKSGFSETVEELRQERGEGEFRKQLHSKNPFENFAGEEDLKEKAAGIKGNISESTNKISEKLTETKEKIKSVFVQPDKENAPMSTA